jgi:hypothetical protein
LGQVTGLAVVVFGKRLPSRTHRHRRAEPIPIGVGALGHDLEPVNVLALSQIADQYLRLGMEIIRYDVEVAIVVEIEYDSGSAGARRHHHGLAALADTNFAAQFLLGEPFPLARAVNFKPGCIQILARLNAEHKFGIDELLALFVQQKGIDAIAIGIAHS